MLVGRGGGAAQHVPYRHQFAVGVGDLDTDGFLARDRAQDPHVCTRHCVGDVLAQRGYPLDFHTRTQFNFVAGDRWSPQETRHLRVDAELVEDLAQCLDYLIVCRS